MADKRREGKKVPDPFSKGLSFEFNGQCLPGTREAPAQGTRGQRLLRKWEDEEERSGGLGIV